MEEIDNIELDSSNKEFNAAADFVEQTNRLVYLTGKAGTGKTTFLKYIRSITKKNTVVVAPTGVAAINARGVTIHSFFQLPFSPFLPNDTRLNSRNFDGSPTIYDTFQYNNTKRKIINELELLIVDEVSMVRVDTMDVMDKVLRVFRGKPYLPFGGVQVILIGDTFQLPPITKPDEWGILSQFYDTPFFFSSKAITENKPAYIELKKIYRQKEQEFIDLLNQVRVDNISEASLNKLNQRYNPNLDVSANDFIILSTHNSTVNEINHRKLNELEVEEFTFIGEIQGDFNGRNLPTEQNLVLKEGAQIMFVKNDYSDERNYYNGKIAKVASLSEDEIWIELDGKKIISIGTESWENIRYTYNSETNKIEEEVIGSYEQFPIRLAWAITVHKSQGLTFEKVYADLNGAFASGQVYVALSRCTSLSGLVLKSSIPRIAIMTDPRVIEFAKNETPSTLITEQLSQGKADHYYKKARERANKWDFSEASELVMKAIKYRNDLELPAFQRYVSLYAKKAQRNKAQNQDLLTSLVKKEEESRKVFKSRELLLTDVESLMNDKVGLERKINSLERKHIVSFNKIKSIQGVRDTTNKKYNKIVVANKAQATKIKKLEAEIRRLNSLSWLEKVTGKK